MTDQPITFLSVHCDDETEIKIRPSSMCSGSFLSFGERASVFLTPKAKEHLMELLSVEPSPNPSVGPELTQLQAPGPAPQFDTARPF